MCRRRFSFTLASVFCLTGASSAFAQATTSGPLRLPKLFADGMVVQRDTRIPVRGWASPGADINVTFNRNVQHGSAASNGEWQVTFPAMPAGGPYELTVESGAERITLHNVLVGNVWIASGQSNMELRVAEANNAAREIANAHDPQLRQFKVPDSWSWTPESDLAGGSWTVADPQHAGDFSAVAYYFARDLRTTIHVPIGIINTSWGGSAIEPWISRAALGLGDSAWSAVVDGERAFQASVRAGLEAKLGGLPAADSGLVNGTAVWADPAYDDAAWTMLPVPGAWERAGYPGLDGVAWYRTTVTLSADEAAQGARLSLATVNDADMTWVNGTLVGQTERYNLPRLYDVPAAALHAGRNVIAVRVTNGGGNGGIIGLPSQVFLETGVGRHALDPQWRFRVALVSIREDGQHINKIPTILYNRMLHPLLPFPIAGVLWYQGESNANNNAQASAYRAQFAALITSWRNEWQGGSGGRGGRKDFPFLWVQLPNFGAVDSVPPLHAAWATMRASQSAALALPATGQAITIDIGDPGNIHPRDKQDVGKRLALLARAVAYGQAVESRGPTYRRHSISGGRVTIEFDHSAGGLVSHAPDNTLPGFAIAGADHNFVAAQARIEGNRVVVWNASVPQPVAVRYAWSNSPPNASLYNQAGLPAPPFRTDTW